MIKYRILISIVLAILSVYVVYRHVPKPKKVEAEATPIKVLIKELTLEEKINNPKLYAIATCESGLRQFDSEGKVIRGKINHYDTGILQINRQYHIQNANKLGYDIDTLDGNISYGKYLYDTQGTRPWLASKPCWSQKV